MTDSSVRAERDCPVVMLVEGEEQLVYLLQRYAEKSGCRFVSARLEEEALEMARRERPAVILVDVVQAETGGQDVLRPRQPAGVEGRSRHAGDSGGDVFGMGRRLALLGRAGGARLCAKAGVL